MEKVESPIVAKMLSLLKCANAAPTPIEPPIHTQVSTAFNGG